MTGNQLIIQSYKSMEYSVYGVGAHSCPSNWIGVPVIVTNDSWLPSPNAPASSYDSPIYYLGDVGIGTMNPNYQLEVNGKIAADSALFVGKVDSGKGININGATATITSPTQTVSFGNDTIKTSGTLKVGAFQSSYLVSDSIKTMAIIPHDSILYFGDINTARQLLNVHYDASQPLTQATITNIAATMIPITYPSYPNSGFSFVNSSSNSCPVYLTVGGWIPDAELNVTGPCWNQLLFSASSSYFSGNDVFTIDAHGNTFTAGNAGINTKTPIAQFQINPIGVGWQTGNNSISMGAMGNDASPFLWSYIGFNAARSNTGSWTVGSDGGHNGGAVIMNTASGGLCFATIPTIGNSIQNIPNDASLTTNNIVMQLTPSGQLVIGIPSTVAPAGYLLAVNGGIIATDVMVKLRSDWPDYVFKKGYPLKSIEELEAFLMLNHHLPGLPSSQELKGKDGISVEEMLAEHTEKLEELTLYIIQLNKEVKCLEVENQKLKEAANQK